MANPKDPGRSEHILRDALFLDLTYIFDSIARHVEFVLNRLRVPVIDGESRLKPYVLRPAFVYFVLVLGFVAYGPTLSGLCGVLGAPALEQARQWVGQVLLPSDLEGAHEIARRVELYFGMLNLLLLGGFTTLYWHAGRGDDLNTVRPVVVAQAQVGPAGGRHFNLAQGLAQDATQPQPPAVVVAASGGGTRAAVYTASLLQGLHELGADRRIVLLSGVSGGGVASAYFAAHRAALLEGGGPGCADGTAAWDCFRRRMAQPFINDVLRGAGEWRLQSDQPLGVLLAESFERRLFGADSAQHLGEQPALGLILNTTLSGHAQSLTPELAATLRPLRPNEPGACQDVQRPLSAMAGGRLIFTNLAQTARFDAQATELPQVRLPVVVINDPQVGLAQAAALNANFPPVFPNARVDLRTPTAPGCPVQSYFVTDGGATENLGLLSALMALDSAFASDPGRQGRGWRDIDIVLSEASAFEFDYTQDRGLGAATEGSRERLAGRLTLELLQRLRARIAPAQIRVHDLSLPRVFRSRGGFGTHWMFPADVRLRRPDELPPPRLWVQLADQLSGADRYWARLDQEQVLSLWAALYERQANFCERALPGDPDVQAVKGWICGTDPWRAPLPPDPQPARWQAFAASQPQP